MVVMVVELVVEGRDGRMWSLINGWMGRAFEYNTALVKRKFGLRMFVSVGLFVRMFGSGYVVTW